MKTPIIPIFLVLCALANTAMPADEMRDGFANPPTSARPWVYYFIMDGNLTREGITADFEAMQRAGIGGMLIMEVNVGIPQGPVKFMSPEWRQLFKHAVNEAERLGLQITLNAGPGWTGSGGPWVKPEQSMQHIVASEIEVKGPARFDAALPKPSPRPAYFGEHLPTELRKAKDAFYTDVAVLAVSRTDATQRIVDIDEKALYLRHPYTSRPGTKPFLPAPALFPKLPENAIVPANQVVNLTDRMDKVGRLTWDAPAGNWTILRFGRTCTGANTRPAPEPGLGLECNKFDKSALDSHFESFAGPLLRELGTRSKSPNQGWTSLHIDSWEMGAQNWDASFRDEFQKRRCYDPLPYLPAVTGRVVASLELSERFLWDLRQTAQELVIENHAQHLKELGQRHGLGLSIEPYDMNPCADLSLGAVADVPMCEFWLYGFNSFFSVTEAASIAHTCGKPVVAAEAFTSSAKERWQAYPGSMKSLGDWAFCAGVNRIVFHRYQHQPWLDRQPGMTMGPYGVHWERTQTWWDMVPAYHAYLARCQFLLRQGLPVADVLFLSAEGAPHVFRPPASATRGSPPDRLGYNFDGIPPETLLSRVSVKDGNLVLPDGMNYRVLVLPDRDTMTPGLLRKVKELAEAGATVIGPRPKKSPSLVNYPKCDEEVHALAKEMWGDGTGCRALGKGRVIAQPHRPAPASPEKSVPLKAAKWIWHPETKPGLSVPPGTRAFRRTVTLDSIAGVQSARVYMTADNAFELTVNGQKAGSGDNFHHLSDLDVASLLRPGSNWLSVTAENGGDAPNPAGMIGALVVKFRDGRTLDVPTDREWQCAMTAGASVWTFAVELGPMGMAPWNLTGEIPPPEPEQYGDFSVVEDVLKQMGVAPDFQSDGPLRYTHRRDGVTDIYFVANAEDREVKATCEFRVAGREPELWNPVTGTVGRIDEARKQDARTVLGLQFAPHQSWFVVFRKTATVEGSNFAGTAVEAVELTGPWEVSFDPKRGGPAQPVRFDKLEDWSKRAEDSIRSYSGTAVYRTTFNSKVPNPGSRHFLDLGKVAVMASVRLNGHELGVVWCAPWRVDISAAVKEQNNRLEIRVANLWPNRLISDQGLPSEKRFSWTTWNPFTRDSPFLESGLLGPVAIGIPNE